MKLYTEQVYKLYMQWVDNVPDEKSTFTPKEIVNAISNIIESNPTLIALPSDEDIKDKSFNNFAQSNARTCFEEGAKWMKSKILGNNHLGGITY